MLRAPTLVIKLSQYASVRRGVTTKFFDKREKGEEDVFIRKQEHCMMQQNQSDWKKKKGKEIVEILKEFEIIVGPSVYNQIPPETLDRIITWKFSTKLNELCYEDF